MNYPLVLLMHLASTGGYQVHSLNDYAGRRYGALVRFHVICLSLISMGLALIAEYTAIVSG